MKILQVCSAKSFGGGERHVADLARALVERGHEVHLAVRPNSPLRCPLSDVSISWHEMGLRNSLDFASIWQMSGLIRREQIQVLHAHAPRDYVISALAANWAKRTQPARLFLTRHHFFPMKGNSLYSWVLSDTRKLIAVSASVQQCLHEAFPKLAEKTVVISNWIDIRCIGALDRESARREMGIQREQVVGLIGQITPLKRQDLFIRAVARLAREGQVEGVEFLLVGAPGHARADVEYHAHLRMLIEQLGVTEYIRFVGYVPELLSRMRAFDVVTLPSENEGFPLTLIEAMAAECGVIATRRGAMTEIIEDEKCGLLFPADDELAFATAIHRLVSDQGKRSQFGKAARRRAHERFERERVVSQIEELYLAG